MNVKFHFLNLHLDHFPEYVGHFSDEQGEIFHQETRTLERRYKDSWDVDMISDYCWSLKREHLMLGKSLKNHFWKLS